MARKTYEPEETGAVLGDAAPAVEAESVPEAEITAPVKKDVDKRCEAGFWCYIGPTLPGLLQHGAILRGSRAEAWQAAAAAMGLPPKVVPWTPGVNTSLQVPPAITPPKGSPPAIPLAKETASG